MRFACLGSGSKGNATILQSHSLTLMVDCGFTMKEVTVRLQEIGLEPQHIDALLVTHEHGDHAQGIAALSRRHGIPVWASQGTLRHLGNDLTEPHTINVHRDFQIGDLQITPVAVPHDASEPCQYIFQSKGYRMGILTDAGHITPHIVSSYRQCDALLLEFNHDYGMLMSGHYPYTLKQRIAGDFGHLSNEQSHRLLQQILPGSLKFLMAGHLSATNNTAAKVTEKLEKIMQQHDCKYAIADQDGVSQWHVLEQPC